MNAVQEPTPPGDDRPALPGLPAEIAILPLFGLVVYPMTVTPLAISQRASVQLIDETLRGSGVIGLVALRDERTRPEQIAPEDCYVVGTAAFIHLLLRLPDGTLRIAAEGIERIVIEETVATSPALRARVRALPEQQWVDAADDRLISTVLTQVSDLARQLPMLAEELQVELLAETSPLRLTYLLAASMLPHSSVTERQALLEQDDLGVRLGRLSALLARELELAERAWQSGAAPPPALNQREPLARRQELLALPLAQELLAQGHSAGLRAALEMVLRARFGATQLDALIQRLAPVEDSAVLQRLVVMAATANGLDEITLAIGLTAGTS